LCRRWGETSGEPQSNNVSVLEVQIVCQRNIKALEHRRLIRVQSNAKTDEGGTRLAWTISTPTEAGTAM
jgi:hypothetical protein